MEKEFGKRFFHPSRTLKEKRSRAAIPHALSFSFVTVTLVLWQQLISYFLPPQDVSTKERSAYERATSYIVAADAFARAGNCFRAAGSSIYYYHNNANVLGVLAKLRHLS